MSFSWSHDLKLHKLDHDTWCSFQRDIDELVRLVTIGWLFENNSQAFFQTRIEPLLLELFKYLHRVYEELESVPLTTTQLSRELQDLGPIIHTDIDAALKNDPATKDALEVVFAYPGFKAISYQRIAHCFYRHNFALLPRLITERAHTLTGIDISPGAQIGSHFFIDHGTGVVIGETSIIGNNVTLYQGVTLGAIRFHRDDTGTVVKGQTRHPIIEDGVTIYAGATVLGRITVGAHSIIGGNVWLTESIPAGSRLTQQRYLTSKFMDGDGI
ncbi:MAG: serine acetyltransferase [Chitinophagaceae bacterium]|nr:serine acetyltransferase [Oligoflexus sp.]